MRYVSVKQLSQINGLPVSFIRKLLRLGAPHYIVQRKNWISPPEFDQWFKQYSRVELNRQSDNTDSIIDDLFKKID